MTHDADIRPVLRDHLERAHPGALVVDELGLELAGARVDLAVIGDDAIYGFEIKAAADTLARLPAQSRVYGHTLDLVTIVVAPNHLADVLASRWVPPCWGVWEAGRHGFRVERAAGPNPDFTLASHAQLLWKPELAALLEAHTHRRTPSRWSKPEIRQALLDRLAPDVLRAGVRAALRARGDAWIRRARMAPRSSAA